MIHLREELLQGECDFAAVHNLLVHAPARQGFPFEALLRSADDMFDKLPVNRLRTLCDAEVQSLIASNK